MSAIISSWKNEKKEEITALKKGVDDICGSLENARKFMLLYIIWRKQIVKFEKGNNIRTETRSELYGLRQDIQTISEAFSKTIKSYKIISDFYESNPGMNIYNRLLIKKYKSQYKKHKKNLSEMVLELGETKKAINAIDTKKKFKNMGNDVSEKFSQMEADFESFQTNLTKIYFYTQQKEVEFTKIQKSSKDLNDTLRNIELNSKNISTILGKLKPAKINNSKFNPEKDFDVFSKFSKSIKKYDKKIKEMRGTLKELEDPDLNSEIKNAVFTSIKLAFLVFGFYMGFSQVYLAYKASQKALQAKNDASPEGDVEPIS